YEEEEQVTILEDYLKRFQYPKENTLGLTIINSMVREVVDQVEGTGDIDSLLERVFEKLSDMPTDLRDEILDALIRKVMDELFTNKAIYEVSKWIFYYFT